MTKKALLVIDYINGIAKTGTCSAYLSAHPELIENTNRLIESFRKAHFSLFFIRIAFDENYAGLPKYAATAEYLKENKKFLIDSVDTQFIPELNFQVEKDNVLNKKYGDPFHGSNLFSVLTTANIEEILFTGVATDNAILNGANTAITHDFKVTIISDACGAATDEQHVQALAMMRNRTASQIITTQEALRSMSNGF